MKLRIMLFTAVVAASTFGVSDAAPVLGPSPTGCPSFHDSGAVTQRPAADLDQEAGPVGVKNQRITGVGLEVADGILTGTVRVEDMKEQFLPPYKATYWQITFRHDEAKTNYSLVAVYDGVEDKWRYTLLQGVASYRGELTGEPSLGPGGGVAISAPLAQFNAAEGMTISGVYAESGSMTYYPQPIYPPSAGGIWSPRWKKSAFPFFPLLPCPGISFLADFTGDQVVAVGNVLPLEDHDVTIERRVEDVWEPVVTLDADSEGAYGGGFDLPVGVHTLRARAQTRALGELVSNPVTVTVDV